MLLISILFILSTLIEIFLVKSDNMFANQNRKIEKAINISYFLTNPDTENHLDDYKFIHIDSSVKCNYILINLIINMINAPSRNVFYTFSNLTNFTNDLTHTLKNGYAEIGGTPLMMTPSNIDFLDFLPSATQTPMYFIYKKPLLAYVKNIYLLPFEKEVWYAGQIMVLLSAVIIYFVVTWEYTEPQFEMNHRPDILEVCIEEVGKVAQQGTYLEPRGLGGGIALIIGLFSLMFLNLAYSAKIVSLIQSRADVITDLESLLGSRITLGIENDRTIIEYFKNENDDLRKNIYYKKIVSQNDVYNVKEGIAKMRNDFFAFHIQELSAYQEIKNTFEESEICCLRSIPFLKQFPPRIVLRKNSGLTEIFKIGMMKLHEIGIQQREYLRISAQKPICFDGNDFVNVGFLHCYTAFLLFFSGLFLSLLILVSEILYFRYTLRKKVFHNKKYIK